MQKLDHNLRRSAFGSTRCLLDPSDAEPEGDFFWGGEDGMAPTAIMVDGGFFLKRHGRCYGKGKTAQVVAKDLFTMCIEHLDNKSDLYRIFFYDCPPLDKKAHNPVSNAAVDFSKTHQYVFRTALHLELVKLRKLALRLGRLADRTGGWIIKPSITKELLSGNKTLPQLTDQDVVYDVKQKGVDMRIGLDIASLAHKRLVRRIVLVTGDADFVPAAKFARREGIDVVLDPMWQQISSDLFEHIDGLKTVCPKPSSQNPPQTAGGEKTTSTRKSEQAGRAPTRLARGRKP